MCLEVDFTASENSASPAARSTASTGQIDKSCQHRNSTYKKPTWHDKVGQWCILRNGCIGEHKSTRS